MLTRDSRSVKFVSLICEHRKNQLRIDTSSSLFIRRSESFDEEMQHNLQRFGLILTLVVIAKGKFQIQTVQKLGNWGGNLSLRESCKIRKCSFCLSLSSLSSPSIISLDFDGVVTGFEVEKELFYDIS